MSALHPVYEHLVAELKQMYRGGGQRTDHEFQIPVARYTDQEMLEREQALMRRVPIPVAHVSQLRERGACLVHDALGVPLLITRGDGGELTAMLNVCRHRGTRLLETPGLCQLRKTVQCPYHGWTYDLTGRLTHVPNPALFPTLDKAERSLVPVPVAERAGLVWVVATPHHGKEYDFDAFLSPITEELESLALGEHVVFRRVSIRRRCNWKLVVEAFLDGYHVSHLHKKTVAPYFKDMLSYSETTGPHIRSIVGRTGFSEALDVQATSENFRDMVTPTYIFFPSTVFVVQPDFVSRATIYPVSLDEIIWEHDLIVPEHPKTEKARAHWELNFNLIQEGVFGSEDLWVCEQIQQGIRSGANTELTFGGLEAPIEWWHEELARRCADSV